MSSQQTLATDYPLKHLKMDQNENIQRENRIHIKSRCLLIEKSADPN